MFKQQKQAAWFVEKKIPAFSVLTHLNIMPLTFGALLFCVFFSVGFLATMKQCHAYYSSAHLLEYTMNIHGQLQRSNFLQLLKEAITTGN